MALHIAGHVFESSPGGLCCVTCGRRWLDVRYATLEDIGQKVSGHGTLDTYGFAEIKYAREVEDGLIWDAVVRVASA